MSAGKRTRGARPPRQSSTVVFVSAGVILGGAATLAIDLDSENWDQLQFIGTTYLLFYYLLWEIWRATKDRKDRAYLQPIVLASIWHFFGHYVLPSVPFFDPESFRHVPYGLTFVGKMTYRTLNTAMFGILLAVFAMWRGYRSRFAEFLSGWLRSRLLRHGIIRQSDEVNFATVGFLFVLSVGAWLASVRLGVFGYSSDAQSLVETSAVRAWLKLGTDAGTLVLLVLAAAAYSPRYQRNPAVWVSFVVVLSWQVAFGLLTGFKSQVVMPVLIVAVAYYTVRGRVAMRWGVVALLMLSLAFRVVDSFRVQRFSDRSFDSTSVGSIVSTVADASTLDARGRRQDDRAGWKKALGRKDLISFTAEAIAFEEVNGTPPGAPDFLRSMLLAPVNAYVPRFLWPDKTVSNDGHWFNVQVLGAPDTSRTAVAMGPVAYLNFAGGFGMVFVGFYAIGLLQRIVWETFSNQGLGGWLVYLSLLSALVILSSNVGGLFTGFLRDLPFVVLAQMLMLRAPSEQRKQQLSSSALSATPGP